MTAMTKRTLLATSAAVTATAVVGALGTDPGSHWYRSLEKPRWQPPAWLFGPAWTTLYALIAVGTARALDRAEDPAERQSLQRALGANLALNAGWNWLFFRARRPDLALAEVLLMEASTLDLARRATRSDRLGGQLLWPYAAWVAFATALNAAIARRNRTRSAR
jgi:tryptophan-rich sensory protein